MVADTVVTTVPIQTAVRTVGDAVSTSIAVNSTEIVSFRTRSALEVCQGESARLGIILTILAESGNFGAQSAGYVDSIEEVAILAVAVGAVGVDFPVTPLNEVDSNVVNCRSLTAI